MVTLKQLFNVFGHDPKWTKLATASAQPMVAVYLRKLGDQDITTLTDFDIEMQYAMSDQPEERKVKAKACMAHLLEWAKEQGKLVPTISDHFRPFPTSVSHEKSTESHENVAASNEVADASHEKRLVKICTRKGDTQIPRRRTDSDLTIEQWQADTRYRTGCIVPETVSKGWKGNKRVFRNRWRATIQVNGIKYHYHAKTRQDCKLWLKAVLAKEILPTDNKADWLRMEQRKDEEARVDEHIVSAAEEANIVYDYRQTGDTAILYDYVTKRLLPHMVYYCCHSLRMSKEKTLTSSRQAVGLILQKIVGGRPVTNITFTCKRMLRIYQSRGDFWYYEKAPKEVKLMVNRIDMSPLEDLYKVTKDRRI